MNEYLIKGRIYPMILMLLPIAIIAITYSIEYSNLTTGFGTLGITTALSYLFSNLGRDRGKKLENSLWKSWGGMPSVIIMGFDDNRLDFETKTIYHEKLKKIAPLSSTYDFETSKIEDLIEPYTYWTKYLISKTRDSRKYNLLFIENISYGFRRNMLGLKPIAISLLLISLIGNYLYQGITYGWTNFQNYSIHFFITEIILVFLLLIWIFVINSQWVKIPAFAYAERLLETINTIET